MIPARSCTKNSKLNENCHRYILKKFDSFITRFRTSLSRKAALVCLKCLLFSIRLIWEPMYLNLFNFTLRRNFVSQRDANGSSQYPIETPARRFHNALKHEISIIRFPNHFKIWLASRQHICRADHQILKWSDHSKQNFMRSCGTTS